MPRLDTSSERVLDYFEIDDYDPNDPGHWGPYDVCRFCFKQHFYGVDGGVEHPDYETEGYTCVICGDALGPVDD